MSLLRELPHPPRGFSDDPVAYFAYWFGQLLGWAEDHPFWALVVIIGTCSVVLPALKKAIAWVYNELPHRRRHFEQLRREKQDRDREKKQLAAKARAEKKAAAEDLKLEHEKVCACKECEGVEPCMKHHRHCDCQHTVACLCQNENDCGCQCRCDCRECPGLRKPRAPKNTTAGSTTSPRPKKAKEPSPAIQWRRANQRYLDLCTAYAEYEADPREVLRLPLLADVTFEPTAAFIEAFMAAGKLATARQPADTDVAAFVNAVEEAVACWDAARAAAAAAAASTFSSAGQVLIRRAESALAIAEDRRNRGGDKSDHEADTAYQRAAHLLRALEKDCVATGHGWRMPDKAQPAIEGWTTHRQITAGAARPDATSADLGPGSTAP